MRRPDTNDDLFSKAVETIDKGDTASLQQLLETHTGLVTKRLDTPKEGYFKNPYLLWFVADNPIRNPQLPLNIVELTKLIIEALQKSGDKNYQYIMNYALGLVATGRIPKKCGVQIPLMELLIDHGAKAKGSVLGPIGQRNFEAANFLIEKGSSYNLAAAVGLNRMADIKKFIKSATASELYVALVVGSFFGRSSIISLLTGAGAAVNGNASKKDFGGFHSHASPLHQAVYSGSLEAVKLLVEAGADLRATDKAYNGTSLEWAIFMQKEENNETAKKRFKEIENYLSAKMV